MEGLVFVTFDVPQWQLVHGLGSGKFSTAYSCRPSSSSSSTDSDCLYAMKVFEGGAECVTGSQGRREEWQTISRRGALILSPTGMPFLPCGLEFEIIPAMSLTLLEDQSDENRIILIDWSSAELHARMLGRADSATCRT